MFALAYMDLAYALQGSQQYVRAGRAFQLAIDFEPDNADYARAP